MLQLIFAFLYNIICQYTCSLAGMFFMFTGLYFVLWAKGKEGYGDNAANGFVSEFDAEKPLLS